MGGREGLGTWQIRGGGGLAYNCPGDTDPLLSLLNSAGHPLSTWRPFSRKVLGSSGWQCSSCCCGILGGQIAQSHGVKVWWEQLHP